MLFTPGPLVGQLSGRLGGIVASHNKGGPYFRNGAIPTLVTSDEAQNAKGDMAASSQAWQDLTDAQRLAWKTWAATNPVINRLGNQITLSGLAAHNQLNCRIRQASGTPITDPPIAAPPTALETLVLDGDIGAGDTDITFTGTPLAAGIALRVWAALTDSAGISYVENLMKLILVSSAAQASPLDIQTELAARFGTLQVGQKLTVKVQTMRLADGQVSGFLYDSVLLTTT